MADFSYFAEQFDDIKILRYQVPAFERLTLREKFFVYYLSRAALAGRDILWDQNNRYNLEVRSVLEKILRDYSGDRECEEFKQFLVYAKRKCFLRTECITIIQWRSSCRFFLRNISLLWHRTPESVLLGKR